MRIRLPAAILAALIALVAFAQPVAAGSYSTSGEGTLLSLINTEHRRVCGSSIRVRQPYQNRDLARWRAKDLLERHYFSHTILGTNNKVFDYFDRYGIDVWQSGGEIIAYNAYYGETNTEAAARAFRQFMGSSTHKSVIQTCRYNAVGVGNYNENGRHYFAVIFTDQPTQRVRYTTTKVYDSIRGDVRYRAPRGARQYIFDTGRDRYGRAWLYGIFPGVGGWGWTRDNLMY